MRTILIAALIMATFAPYSLAQTQQAQPAPPAYTDISGTVLSVRQLTFPHTRLSIKVTQSSNPAVLALKGKTSTVTVENYLWSVAGQLDFKDKRNIASIGAFYLLQGDEINAKLINGATRGSVRYVYGISRGKAAVKAVTAVKKLQQPESIKKYDDLELSIKTDSDVYAFGAPVPLVLSVRNIGSRSKTLRFDSGQKFDFIAMRGSHEIWRWSDNEVFIEPLVDRTLGPGEVLTFKQVWRQQDSEGRQMGTGEYKILGVLTTSDRKRPTVGPISIKIVSKP